MLSSPPPANQPEDYIGRVRSTLSRLNEIKPALEGLTISSHPQRVEPHMASLRNHIEIATELSRPRMVWSSKVRFFPFNLPFVCRAVLAVLRHAFADQRNVNQHLLLALSEQQQTNEILIDHLLALRIRVAELQDALHQSSEALNWVNERLNKQEARTEEVFGAEVSAPDPDRSWHPLVTAVLRSITNRA